MSDRAESILASMMVDGHRVEIAIAAIPGSVTCHLTFDNEPRGLLFRVPPTMLRRIADAAEGNSDE